MFLQLSDRRKVVCIAVSHNSWSQHSLCNHNISPLRLEILEFCCEPCHTGHQRWGLYWALVLQDIAKSTHAPSGLSENERTRRTSLSFDLPQQRIPWRREVHAGSWGRNCATCGWNKNATGTAITVRCTTPDGFITYIRWLLSIYIPIDVSTRRNRVTEIYFQFDDSATSSSFEVCSALLTFHDLSTNPDFTGSSKYRRVIPTDSVTFEFAIQITRWSWWARYIRRRFTRTSGLSWLASALSYNCRRDLQNSLNRHSLALHMPI
jgi:hypothetical protein